MNIPAILPNYSSAVSGQVRFMNDLQFYLKIIFDLFPLDVEVKYVY